MTLFTEWQYPEGYLDFVSSQHPDPVLSWASTDGEHGYETTRVLFSYLPTMLTEDPYLRDLFWAQGIELDAIRGALDSILAGFYVDSAPEWALRLWERFVGRVEASGGLSLAQRRALVKQLLNLGARTVSDFESFVLDFTGVAPELIVIQESFATYEVTITVQVGLSAAQQAEFEFAFRRFLPAHLDLIFQYGGFIAGVNLAGDTL